jgi:hypothetical protein
MHVKKNHTKVETARAYKNKSGKDCFTGTKHLKDTETLECIWSVHFHFVVEPFPKQVTSVLLVQINLMDIY